MNEVQPPPLPYTLRAGDRPVAVVRGRLVSRGGPALLGAAVLGLVIAIVSGELSALIFPIAFVGAILVLIAVVGLPLLRLYGRSTVTVSESEVVVKRIRRRTIARSDVGGMVLGYFTVAPTDFTDTQVCLVRRDGSRWVTLPSAYWDADGLAQMAAAIGVEPRWQGKDDEHLRPFYVRHRWVTAFGGAFVLLILIIGSIVIIEAIGSHQRRDDAAASLRTWNAEQAPRVRALPGFRGVEADNERTSIALGYDGGEAPRAPARRARELACAGRDASLRVDLRFVDRSDEQQEAGRELRFTCETATDPGFVLDGLAARPLPRSVRYASFDLSPATDFHDRVTGTRLEVFASPELTEAQARATLCSLRAPRGELVLQGALDDC